MSEPDNSKVICPNCCHEFGAISVNDQKLRRIAADTIEQMRELLKLVQSDRGNWLHSGLQERIEAAVGPPGPYRALDDAPPDRTPLERIFSESPATPIIEDALKRLSGD